MTELGGYSGNPRDALQYLNTIATPDGTVAFHRRNLPRLPLDDRTDCLATGVMTSVPIYLQVGDVITNISVVTGGTAGATMTHWWFALYSNAATPALLAQSADQTSGAIAANTVLTQALATAQTITKSGIYRVGIMVAASTVPSLLGAVGAPVVLTHELVLAQNSGSALAATAPATIASPAVQKAIPMVVVS